MKQQTKLFLFDNILININPKCGSNTILNLFMNKEGNPKYLPISDKFTNSLHKNKFKHIINDLNSINLDEYLGLPSL